MTQEEILEQLLQEARNDGHDIDLSVLDLLDYLAILGYELVAGDGCAVAYAEKIRAMAS